MQVGRLVYWFLIFGLISALLANMLSQILNLQSNKDMDTFMYFGTRLLSGELIWVHEFEDKLPVVQYFFVIPAFFESYKPWVLISIAMLATSAGFLFRLIKKILVFGRATDARLAKSIAMISCLIYCYMAASLEGGFHHINSFATSLFVVALALILCPLLGQKSTDRSHLQIFMTASLLLAIAISIRPYFALPTAILFLTYYLITQSEIFDDRPLNKKEMVNNIFHTSLYSGSWFGATLLFAFLLNFLPYLFSGAASKFMPGITLMLADTIPSSVVSTLNRQFYYAINSFTPATSIVFVYIFPAAVCLSILNIIKTFRHFADNKSMKTSSVILISCCLLIPAMLEFTFLIKHYWEHYAQMFTPFAAIGIGWILSYTMPMLSALKASVGRRIHQIFSFAALIAIIGLFQGEIIKDTEKTITSLFGKKSFGVSEFRSLDSFEEFKQQGFFAPYSMKIHWISKEPRYGFPHQAHTRHVERGRWEDVTIPLDFHFPRTSGEYCEKIMGVDAKFVLVTKKSVLDGCLSSKESKFMRFDDQLTKRDQVLLETATLAVYSRIP